jgi:hypothetical protein
MTARERPKDIMIRIPGSEKLFRCDCGCNVFREIKPRKYKCNSCDAVYSGEP